MKQILITLLFLITLPVHAYQDCMIFADGRLTDISIEDNTIVNVYPLITIMNEKNTLIVEPLKTGSTRFCVLKNNKQIVMFNIKVEDNLTTIDDVEGFDIVTIDKPDKIDDDFFELDKPPMLYEGDKWTN